MNHYQNQGYLKKGSLPWLHFILKQLSMLDALPIISEVLQFLRHSVALIIFTITKIPLTSLGLVSPISYVSTVSMVYGPIS